MRTCGLVNDLGDLSKTTSNHLAPGARLVPVSSKVSEQVSETAEAAAWTRACSQVRFGLFL